MSDRPRIAHVGVAVTDLDAALAFYRDVLGLTPHPTEEADGAAIVSLPFGESEVELLAPIRTDSPIARFLERRGPGIHHICYRVPDLEAALASCRAAGYRLVTLTNGAVSVADRLLGAAGVRAEFEALLSVDDAGAWKPSRAAYSYAARVCGVRPADMLLVAVHPWDIDGAVRAGLRAAWVNRAGLPYPSYFTLPSITVTGLDDLAQRIADLS